MGIKRALSVSVGIVLAILLAALLLGLVLGQPILVSFVETGSMEPTIDAGDGFVAIPAAISGEVSTGDVIVFEAEEIQGGGLVTHRVVGETSRGYITRGDASPFTDQDSTEPPVKDAQIVAEALQIGGSVVVIPQLGTLVLGFQGILTTVQRELASLFGTRLWLGPEGIGLLIFGLSLVAFAVDYLLTGPQSIRKRSRSRKRDEGHSNRLILGLLAMLVMVSGTAAMVAPAGTQQYGIVSSEFDSDNPTVIRTGESKEVTYATGNSGFIPVYVYLEGASDGVEVEPRKQYVESHSEATATVTLHAPPETGYYRRFVSQHRYIAVLPGSVIQSLHEIHPWTALLAINAFLGGGFYVLGALLIGHRGRVRFRRRSRSRPSRSVVRLLRSLYR